MGDMKEKNKDIEQIIKNLEEQGILEAIGDGVSIQDTDFKVLYQNQVHKNIIGDHAGEYCYEAYAQREKTCEGCPVAMAFKDGKTHTTERSVPAEKGIIYIEVTASPIRDLSGKIIAGIEVARDITRRKQAQEALEESENEFRSLAEKSLVGIYLFQDGVFKYVNPKLAEIFGYTVEELIDKKGPQDLTLPEDWLIVEENTRRRISGEIEAVNYNFRGIKKNKDIIYIEVYGSRTIYQGRPAVIGTLLDITERKQTEEILQQEKDKAQKYLDVAGVIFLVINRDKKVALINKKGCEVLGYKEDEIIGKNWFETFIPEKIRNEIISVFEKLMSGKVELVEYYENPVLTKRGEEKIIAWHNALLKDENGNNIGTISSGEDITERKKMEKEVKERIAELEKFYEMAIGRELRMKELKDEIKRLQIELAKYQK